MKLMKIYEDVFSRKNMPQIGEDDFKDAFNVLMDNKIGVTKDKMMAKDMISSQEEIIAKKKKGIAEKIGNSHLSTMQPIIVSEDNFCVDGHHRIAAIKYLKREYERVPVIRIMLPQVEAIAAYNAVADQL